MSLNHIISQCVVQVFIMLQLPLLRENHKQANLSSILDNWGFIQAYRTAIQDNQSAIGVI